MEMKVLELYKKGYGINKIASSLKIKKNVVKKIIDKNESVKRKEISKEHIDTEEKEITVTNIDVNNNKKENNTSSTTNEIDKEKLNILLNNLDKLLNLIPEESNDDIKLNSDKTTVTSLRINEELYDHVKKYAERKKIKISEILNKALLDYLNNYV